MRLDCVNSNRTAKTGIDCCYGVVEASPVFHAGWSDCMKILPPMRVAKSTGRMTAYSGRAPRLN
jgi:hypothetical protein